MSSKKESIYSMERGESIIADPDGNWKTLFKETVISMIASNKNELLWYANFLSRCAYEFHFEESFASSVYFNGQNFVIVINPVILGIIEKDQVIAILKHSAGHIINHHFSRPYKEGTIPKEIVETAKDIVINGSREVPYIKDLPRTGNYTNSPLQAHFYQTLNEKYGIEQYETGRAFEYYVDLMLTAEEEESKEDREETNASCSTPIEEDVEEELRMNLEASDEGDEENTSPAKNEENKSDSESPSEETQERVGSSASDESGEEDNPEEEQGSEPKSLSQKTLEALENGECQIDSHSHGEQLQEAVGLEQNLMETFMDTTLKEMIEDATDFARGFTPGEATDALSYIKKRKSHKDWRKIFNKKMRNFLTNSMRYREPNKSRQHPIYPDDLDLYGYTLGKKPKIGVVLDVSGSVDDKLLSSLMSEVQSIQRKYGIKHVTLVQVDAQIQSIEKFGVRDKFITRQGSGGTIMEPGFTALLKQSSREIPDLIICATDGEIEERFEQLKVPNSVQVIWLVTKERKLAFDTSIYPKQQMHVISFSV